jgi:hypothetical protein
MSHRSATVASKTSRSGGGWDATSSRTCHLAARSAGTVRWPCSTADSVTLPGESFGDTGNQGFSELGSRGSISSQVRAMFDVALSFGPLLTAGSLVRVQQPELVTPCELAGNSARSKRDGGTPLWSTLAIDCRSWLFCLTFASPDVHGQRRRTRVDFANVLSMERAPFSSSRLHVCSTRWAWPRCAE